jgi:hypothetical protein
MGGGKMQVKIACIGGVMSGNEVCSFCFEPKATIYVVTKNNEMIPACNDCIEPGSIGEIVEVNELPMLAKIIDGRI